MKKIIKKYENQFIVLILATLFLELVFIFGLKAYPFKNANLLISDLYYEYVPFYNYVRDAILSGRSILNSFSFTMGQSMIGILSYYCLSPLNLLLLFSNLNNITYFIKILFFLKIVLCALNMSIYLNNKTDKLHNIIFSLIYAFITYNIKYGFNIMWLDVIYILPLVILGLEKMIDGKSSKLYIISLAIMVFSNFYIAFGACIFIFIYFLYYSFINRKLKLKLFYKFVLFSIIPVLLNTFMLFPTVFNMLDGKAIEASNGYDKLILYNPLYVIYNFTPGTTAGHILNDLPYFYSSTLVLVLFINYLFSDKISFREKWSSFLIVMFIIFTTLIEPLDLIFHCFRVPNCLYYRYMYILPFFLISIVSRNKIKMNWFSLIPILIISTWVLLIEFSVKMIVFATLMLIYFVFIKAKLKYIVAFILVGELFYSTLVNIKAYDGFRSYDNVKKYGELLKDYYPKENEFYRIELNEPVTINDSFILGYYGIDSFSPTITNSSKIFLKKYLLLAEAKGLNYVYQNRTILDPYFLGVKYEVLNGEVKENDYYLPLIVKTNSFDYFEPADILIENSNNLYKMINGEYLFKEIDFEIDCIKGNVIVNKECKIDYKKKDGYNYYFSVNTKAGDVFNHNRYIENSNVLEVDKTFSFSYDNVRVENVKLYEFDKTKIKNQTNEFEVFRDEYMRMNVDKGLYLMMVPYDDSWHVKVNGKEIEKVKVLDSLIGFETDGGVLEIEFIPKGLTLGLIVSGVTISILVIYLVRKKNGCEYEKNSKKI